MSYLTFHGIEVDILYYLKLRGIILCELRLPIRPTDSVQIYFGSNFRDIRYVVILVVANIILKLIFNQQQTNFFMGEQTKLRRRESLLSSFFFLPCVFHFSQHGFAFARLCVYFLFFFFLYRKNLCILNYPLEVISVAEKTRVFFFRKNMFINLPINALEIFSSLFQTI